MKARERKTCAIPANERECEEHAKYYQCDEDRNGKGIKVEYSVIDKEDAPAGCASILHIHRHNMVKVHWNRRKITTNPCTSAACFRVCIRPLDST